MELAWLIPVLSFIAFPIIVFWGKRLPGGGAPLAIGAIAAGFALFWVALLGFLAATPDTEHCLTDAATGTLACNFQRAWFNAGLPGLPDSVALSWGMTIDPLALAMLGMVTLVALMVQIYSLGYMKGDPHFGWYYACHALFAAAMLTLVLADSFLLLYVAWELVGACSYLLIGFWHERPAAREAAKKAFIVTRLGDVGLLLGILLLWREVGSFSMTAAFELAHSGEMSHGVATASSLLMLLGAMGKSAQFPFHVWLPDAMEGPTPVSALIHAATMVAAGVYLVARAFPIFQYSGDALMAVAIVGLVTALMASTIALTSTDLKRILAYSTISHLGLMMLSLGAGGYTAALFHLLAHGFSKALLFLGAGSVLHSTEQQDIRHMGGLRKAMPLTALLFSLGAMSLGGIPILAGFWSKDEVLSAVSHGLHPVFIVLALVTALLSALYMARAMFVVFFGPSPESEHHDHPVHDAPLAMAAPMVLLGVLAAGFGLISFNWPGSFGGIGSFLFYHEPEGFHFTWWLGILSTILAVAAFAFGYLVYVRKSLSLEGFRRSFAPAIRVVERKYYVDELYQWVVDRVVMVFSRFIALFDRAVVNDVLVNGPANSARRLGVAMRLHVTGHVYSYALVMALGAAALAILWWWRVA
ncbi:MAG: NADH-quinone oxidoreductase subunit L [Dehalococcoidia bacterium]|nr:NADH-quinone oxidoreductase subunit L [Dehalococcoidia bacterium]MSQ16058.1 NADH-quinone oxidoreductase subunit L [Dehalococcoidia bacterium]